MPHRQITLHELQLHFSPEFCVFPFIIVEFILCFLMTDPYPR